MRRRRAKLCRSPKTDFTEGDCLQHKLLPIYPAAAAGQLLSIKYDLYLDFHGTLCKNRHVIPDFCTKAGKDAYGCTDVSFAGISMERYRI